MRVILPSLLGDKLVLANTIVQNTYNAMKTSAANRPQIGDALDIAGIRKELFRLAMNLESYSK